MTKKHKKKSEEKFDELEREWSASAEEVFSKESASEKSSDETHGAFVKKELDEESEVSLEVEPKKTHKHESSHKKKTESAIKEVEGEDVYLPAEEKEFSEFDNKREKVIADQLTEIYENSDGSMPDMKTFESKKNGRFVRAFIMFLFSCLFFAGAAWVGLFVLQPRSQFSEEDVVLDVSGEELIVPGNDGMYRVRYANTQSVALYDVSLEIRYPEGFTVKEVSVESQDETMNTWELGTLDPGESGYIDITGIFFGDSGSKQSIRAFLSYKPENFTSNFQKVATKTVEAKQDVADIVIEMIHEVARGAETPVVVTVTPEAGQVLKHVELRCVSPDFAPSGKTAPVSDEPCAWSFDELSSPTVIELGGIFAGTSSTGVFGVELRGWDSEEKLGEGFLLAEKNTTIAVIESATNVSLVINGGVGDTTIAPGDTIAASIVVQNKGDTPLTDVVIEAVIDGPSYSGRSILGWQDIVLTGDADIEGEQLSADTRQGRIIWSKKYLPELAVIAPGKQVQVDVSIPIRSGDQITLANFTTNNIIFSSNFSHGAVADRKTLDSNTIDLALVSDFALEVDYQITEMAGVAGVYQTVWTLTNSFHPLKNITLEADIYGEVEVNTSTFVMTSGEVEYDAVNKKIIWKIGEMPTSVDVLNLGFDIILKTDNPTQKDLMSKVRMSAEDEVVNITIKKVSDGISLR
jgi:hypothetical protein